jgi:hypothetical protein
MMRLIDAHPEPFRTLSMLVHATGLEILAALALRKRDLIPDRRAVRAPGTKTRIAIASHAIEGLRGRRSRRTSRICYSARSCSMA